MAEQINNPGITGHRRAGQSVALLSFALNKVREAAFLIDEAGRLQFVNEEACSVLGYTMDELLALGVPDLDPDFTVERWPSHWQDLKTHTSLVFEGRHRRKDGTLIPVEISANYIEYEGRAYNLALVRDITERKEAEREREAQAHFYESLDRVNRAMQAAPDLTTMMSDTLDAMLAIFHCDRAFLLFPCDPDATTWQVPMERTRVEYPGVLALGIEVATSDDVAQTFRSLLETGAPVKFGPETDHPLPADAAERFGFQSLLSMAVHPRIGKPWQFGLHQCSYGRVWTAQEERLFQEIGRRLADGLSTMLVDRDLRTSEARYRRIIDTASEGIWGFGPDTSTTFANTRMTGMLGYALEEMMGRSMTDFMFPEDLPDYEERLKGRLAGIRETYERRFKRKDGRTLWTLVSATPIIDDQHRFEGAFGMFTDITERKRVEEALLFLARRGWQSSGENFFEALAQFLGEQLDMDYVFIDRLTENPEEAETVALFSRGSIVPNLRYALKGTPCENVMGKQLCVYSSGIQGLFPEDSLLPGMGAESYSGIPLWDSTGQPIGLIAVLGCSPLSDVAPVTQLLQLVATRAAAELEREQNNRLLRAREHEFRTLAENLPDNIVRHDREGRVIYVNPALEKTLGENASRMLGKRMRDMYPDGSFEIGAQAVDVALATGENQEIELSVNVPGSGTMVHQIRTIVERNERGEVSGVLSIGRDITERKQAEESMRRLNQELEQRVVERTAKLEAANRELESFAFSVSHDLRAPLRHIDGFLGLLKKRAGPVLDAESQHYMSTISDAAKRMAALIDDLLSFSRTGRTEMVQAQIDLNVVVREVIAEFEPEMAGRSVRWDVGPLPVVSGDRALLRLVFTNLVSNALKFSRHREHSHIEIGALTDTETETVLFVRDNGVGFDMRYADKLFGVFQRLHGVDQFDGTGIGLANVRRVVERHGGRTWAEGRVDDGATFYFSLPRNGAAPLAPGSH